ncbi:hypothetical protein STENM223S_01994 [Streptomyces tendae]
MRRDVARLRELGYAVDSDLGPWGGYRLRPGTRTPPLILDDDEALAVAVGLREAALSGALGGDQSALSALLKLRQVLPKRLGDRLGDMDAAFVQTPRAGEPQVAAGTLLEPAAGAGGASGPGMAYRDWEGRASVRDVDPYRLVHTGRRWYFVARDVERGESGGPSGPTGSSGCSRPGGPSSSPTRRPIRRCSCPARARPVRTRCRPLSVFRCPWSRRRG